MFLQKKMSNSSIDKSKKSRIQILEKLKAACDNKNGLTNNFNQSVHVFPEPHNLLETFVEECTNVNGEVILCEGQKDLWVQLANVLDTKSRPKVLCYDSYIKDNLPDTVSLMNDEHFVEVEVGLTRCEALIARSGSVLVSSSCYSGRLLNVFPPVHIVVARASNLVPFIENAIAHLKQKYVNNMPSQATIITGPSRTADIEKTLVMGAHGPKELLVLIDINS